MATAVRRRLPSIRARRRRDLARRERALAEHRAALVQLISHELRTPLTVIHGAAETLQARPGAVTPECSDLLDALTRATTRLEEMVDIVLAAAEGLDADPDLAGAVELAPLVEHAAASLGGDVRARLVLDVAAGTTLHTIEAHLRLAVRCLLDNAVKFSPPGSPVRVSCVGEASGAAVLVRDHGPGLPEGFERLAFEPFTQGDPSLVRAYGGLGMGLHTARQLVRRLGGDVTLRSITGEGCIARIHLPPTAPGRSPTEAGARAGERGSTVD